MTLPALMAPVAVAPSYAPEDFSKKIRKPYTITKSRESWTEQEHDKFLEALQLFDRDWKKIEAFIGTKNVIQIRSHAQKYFLKVQKNGTGEHVPPPRPKRKSAQPYPQKPAKSAPVHPCFPKVGTTSAPECDFGYTSASHDGVTMAASPWVHHVATSNDTDWKSNATPDFTEIYTFLGNIFDPSMTEHLHKLKEMSCIDRETILLLMRNLSINLSSTEFQEHKYVSSAYDTSVVQPLSAVASHA